MSKFWLRLKILSAVFIGSFYLVLSQSMAATITVNCSSQTIENALFSAVDGDRIEVSGTCTETAVKIDKNRITLDGGGSATIEHSGSSPRNLIQITGLNVRIENFASITGSRVGISVGLGGSARITNNTVNNSGSHGILVADNGAASIDGNTIDGNGFHGIRIARNGAAQIFDNTITNNAGLGIHIADSSSGEIRTNTITGNSSDGILVSSSSAIRLSGGPPPNGPNILENNGGFGISCFRNASLEVSTAQVFGTGAKANSSGDAFIDESCGLRLRGTAVGTIEQEGSVTFACFHLTQGKLRIVDSLDECKEEETGLTWDTN